MSNDIAVTLQTILALFGGFTCIAGGVSAIVKLLSPFKELKQRIDAHDEKLDEDYRHFKKEDAAIQEFEKSNRVVCKSLLVLLNHEITGNGIDKLKEQKDELEKYLINK